MPIFPLAIRTSSLQLPLKKALKFAAQIGVQAVEIDGLSELRIDELTETGIRQFRKMLDDLNLKVAAIRFQTRRGYNVPEELDLRVSATKAAMKMAYRMGAKVVINRVGVLPTSFEHPEAQMLIDVLRQLGDYGNHVGARLAIATGSEEPQTLAALLGQLEEGTIGVNFDPGSLLAARISPTQFLSELGSQVIHVHATDGVYDLQQASAVAVPLGRGTADFPQLLGQLEEHTYRGYLTLQSQNNTNFSEYLVQSVEYLKNIF